MYNTIRATLGEDLIDQLGVWIMGDKPTGAVLRLAEPIGDVDLIELEKFESAKEGKEWGVFFYDDHSDRTKKILHGMYTHDLAQVRNIIANYMTSAQVTATKPKKGYRT